MTMQTFDEVIQERIKLYRKRASRGRDIFTGDEDEETIRRRKIRRLVKKIPKSLKYSKLKVIAEKVGCSENEVKSVISELKRR